MERAIKDLCRLSDSALFEEVATGIGHVMDTVNGLDAATHELSKAGHHHPARVLGNLAEEEAAKVLILVDAVRCPRGRQNERPRTLGYFYQHLAKGIYTDVSSWRPADFKEVMKGVDDQRRSHYLDGPNDVDWIYRNSITRQRMDDLYVGYVREDSEKGDQGKFYWASPRVDDPMDTILGHNTPAIIRLARALHEVKATTPPGLSVIAEIWRPVEVHAEMRFGEFERLNRRTLEALEDRGLLARAPDAVYAVVLNDWTFPLWPLDLSECKVEKERLREVQRRWPPNC